MAGRGIGPGGDVSTATGVGFVVSGAPDSPIATIETTAPHGLIPGNYVQIFNVGDVSYSAALNGVVVPVASVPSSTQFTVAATYGGVVMPNGDYSAGYLGNRWQVRSMNEFMDMSWLTWLNVYMKGYFTVVASYAQGGTGSSVGVTLLPKIKNGPAADYAFVQYCTNDLNSSAPDTAGCIANVKTIVAAVLEMGMVPVVCLPLAIGDKGATPSDPASSVKTQALQVVRAALLALATQDSRVLVLDTYAASVDPDDPLGRFKANYAPVDGIHPSSFGASSIAQTIATYLEQFLPPPDTLPASIFDDATLVPSASDIVQNGLMAGTAGTVSTSPDNALTGTSPTGWGIGGSGGTDAAPLIIDVAGQNSYAGVPGYTFDLSVVAAAAGEGFQIGTNGAGGSSFGARMQAARWYRCGFQAFPHAALPPVNLSGQVFMNFGLGNTPSVYFMASEGSLWENGIPWAPGQTLTFETQPFFTPTVPTGGAWLFINGLFTGSLAGQTLSIDRAFCRIVPSPYQ